MAQHSTFLIMSRIALDILLVLVYNAIVINLRPAFPVFPTFIKKILLCHQIRLGYAGQDRKPRAAKKT